MQGHRSIVAANLCGVFERVPGQSKGFSIRAPLVVIFIPFPTPRYAEVLFKKLSRSLMPVCSAYALLSHLYVMCNLLKPRRSSRLELDHPVYVRQLCSRNTRSHVPVSYLLVRSLYSTRYPHSLQRIGSPFFSVTFVSQSPQRYCTGLEVSSKVLPVPPMAKALGCEEPAALFWLSDGGV